MPESTSELNLSPKPKTRTKSLKPLSNKTADRCHHAMRCCSGCFLSMPIQGFALWVSGLRFYQCVQACTPKVVPVGFGNLLRDCRGLHWPV